MKDALLSLDLCVGGKVGYENTRMNKQHLNKQHMQYRDVPVAHGSKKPLDVLSNPFCSFPSALVT